MFLPSNNNKKWGKKAKYLPERPQKSVPNQIEKKKKKISEGCS